MARVTRAERVFTVTHGAIGRVFGDGAREEGRRPPGPGARDRGTVDVAPALAGVNGRE